MGPTTAALVFAVIAAAPAEAPFEGLTILGSEDGRYALRFRFSVQANARWWLDDAEMRAADTFFIRRARPQLEGRVFGCATFKFMPDISRGTAEVFDAWFDLELHRALHLRAGKMKSNFGLERLQSQTDLVFVERSQASGLAPNRDVGAMVHGDLAGGAFHYSAAVWNGVADGASGDLDADDRYDYTGRVFVKPFRFTELRLLHEVGVGIAGTYGIRRGSPASPVLPGYRSPALQRVFGYDADVYANGPLQRIAPQAAIYVGPAGVMAEYVRVRQRVKRGDDEAVLTHDAWQVTASVLVTGERATYGTVAVAEPVSLSPLSIGAVELAVRYDAARYSKAALGRFASRSYSGADAAWFGVSWYPAPHLKVTGNFTRARFRDVPAGLPAKEDVLQVQLQLAF